LIWNSAPIRVVTPKTTKKKPPGLRGVDRQHREADDVLLGPAGPGPLGVLLVDEQQHVRGDEPDQDPGISRTWAM
jgi:hypothetical protein